ncbi:hypothetical protein GCM10010910_01620 [Microbacterium nanhaiense]|uniref:HTH cro/C1-type domain-containing protein n=1 Tax=Microbacterium nanhaiense TaxID=1301026 RepID=A0ABQ2MW82_9MICO|nr:helix-turn-helix transcriptional regulator [Microbacterium nanhaiense]GGO59205.1 hypothetical protein GCM10010910_01620 [Microbacterium nanhaiense]
MDERADITDEDVAGAVRAEMARRLKKQRDLVAVLGMSWPTVSSRLHGRSSFTISELAKIAAFLDMTVGELFESAVFGSRVMNPASAYREQPRGEIPIMDAPRDPWEQPAGSHRRRRGRS